METRYTPEQFAILLQRLIENRYSQADIELLTDLIDQPEYHFLAVEMIEGTMEKMRERQRESDPALLNRLDQRLATIITQEKIVAPVHRVHFLRRYRWIAAAVFLFAIATTYLLVNKKAEQPTLTAKADVAAPDKNRATITLGNGKTIYLDTVQNGRTIEVDGVQLTKLSDGKIVYAGDANTVVYNTASNPRGSKVMDLELNDHSHVWLNAGSSITYPVVFNGKDRKVNITGEAYFEVAHDANKPFIVSKGATSVQVLGTHFNVKAYDNEPSIKVTLLEGSVQVRSGDKQQLLQPGQQALVAATQIDVNKEADTEEAMAWKNGYTSFHGATLQTVVHELERWYDIDIENKLTQAQQAKFSFYVDVKRTASLEEVLTSVLKDRNIVYEFNEVNRKLTILP